MDYKRVTGFDMYPGLVTGMLRCFAWSRAETTSAAGRFIGLVSYSHTPLEHKEALKW